LEVVFTITIIGILLAICLPVMSAIKLSAQKLKDVSNLQTIAAAWKEYTVERGNTMNLRQGFGANYTDYGSWFAWSLAGVLQSSDKFYPSKCVLNDPNVYISPGDKYASKTLQEYIRTGVDGSEGCAINDSSPWSCVANADFGITSSNISFFLSYCTIANLDGSVPLATTPLAFTRGLKSDGTWDEKYGLYGSKGGYVVFCDGHVTWFDGSKPAKFLHWNGQEYTTDIRQTVPNIAKIGNGNVHKTPTAQYSNIVIWGSGTGGE
ncbi:MAG: type II secretion system GspH family protein, partial [Puniceicoccales bacterium]|nr:type II secretion system GspH family protein [Puniceicoccales bacterium]